MRLWLLYSGVASSVDAPVFTEASYGGGAAARAEASYGVFRTPRTMCNVPFPPGPPSMCRRRR